MKAKIAGEQEGKWLIVNIQDSKEFKCQQLNRDVWSNEAVRNIMAENFLLWQVITDTWTCSLIKNLPLLQWFN
jgi:thioredoxin-related protein